MGTGTLWTTPWKAGMKGSQEVTKRLYSKKAIFGDSLSGWVPLAATARN